MPHLVGAENAEHRRAVCEPLRPERPEDARPEFLQGRLIQAGQDVRRAEIGREGSIMVDADESGGPAGEEEQQDVQPPPMLEPAGWRKRRVNGQPPMFWRSLPGLNRMVRPGGIRTSLPVRGLRPMPRLRGLTWNTPKPRSSIRSPRCMEIRIASNTASTATSALTLVMSAMRDTSLTMSTLIMLTGSWGSVNIISIVTYAVNLHAKLTF